MRVEVGNWVRHYGNREWGEVLRVVPQHDKTLEIEVQCENPICEGASNSPRCWASYHIDQVLNHKPTDADRRVRHAWRPLGGLG